MVGVSTHTLEEARHADDEGASYILFGPVFAPLAKTFSLPARGLAELERVCRGTRVPVFALGGITEKNAADCERAGADGSPELRCSSALRIDAGVQRLFEIRKR